MQKGLLLALALGAAVACSENSGSTAPTTAAALTGRWTGPMSFQGVSGVMTVQLTQTGGSVTGPVTIALPSGVVLLNGFLTGTLTGSSLTYTISVGAGGIPAQPQCAGQLTGTMTATAVTLSGPVTLTSSNCTSLTATTAVTLIKS